MFENSLNWSGLFQRLINVKYGMIVGRDCNKNLSTQKRNGARDWATIISLQKCLLVDVCFQILGNFKDMYNVHVWPKLSYLPFVNWDSCNTTTGKVY